MKIMIEKRRLAISVWVYLLVGILIFICPITALGIDDDQPKATVISANAKVISGNAVELDSYMEPYITMARQSLPETMERFVKGLPSTYKLLVTAKMYDKNKNFEHIILQVKEIKNQRISGNVDLKPVSIQEYQYGDKIEISTKDVCDWTIVSPDGKKEGNYVGKMLDVMLERKIGLMMEVEINEAGRVVGSKFLRAITPSQQDVTFCIDQPLIEEACRLALTLHYVPNSSLKKAYDYLVYDFFEGTLEKRKRK